MGRSWPRSARHARLMRHVRGASVGAACRSRGIGVYRGVESETHYRLVDRDGERYLVPVSTFEAPAGHVEALVPPAENIHSVAATGDEKTVSIHVYGADIERLGTSILRRFDDVEQLVPA